MKHNIMMRFLIILIVITKYIYGEKSMKKRTTVESKEEEIIQNQDLNLKDKYRISVIIPCYNQENHIQTCLDSIALQKFEGLEIILVDDGSTDMTKIKIEEYKLKHPNLDIFYYFQENAGPGVARNTGLKNAHGKYIAFMDSDDKLPAGAYTALFYTAEKTESDVVIGEYFRKIDNGNWYVYDYIRDYCKQNEGKNCAGDYIVAIKSPSLWNRLFNREFLNANKIKFLPEMHGEDNSFNIETVKHAKKIYTTQSLVYCYTKRTTAKDSISTSWNLKNTSSYINSIKSNATYFDKINDPYTEMVYFNTHFCSLLHGINSMRDAQWQKELFEQFKEVLVLYKGNKRYEKFIELILGVELEVVLGLSYRAYKSLLYKINQSNQNSKVVITNTANKIITGDAKGQVLQDFKNGKIGFKYILHYIKAWFSFKIRGKKKP